MKAQTKDNFRCLAAAICFFAVLIVGVNIQATWFPSLPVWAFIALFFVLILIVMRLFNPRPKTDRVVFDENTITRTLPDGKIESVRWDDLQEVGVVTTDEGPFSEDVYWILSGSKGGCAVSGGAAGMKELLERLQKLPNFDNEAVIKAMGTTTSNKIQCWKRN